MSRVKLLARFFLCVLSAACLPVPGVGQEDRVSELEKQLRATQQFFAGEIAAMQKTKEEKKPERVSLMSAYSEKFTLGGFMALRYEWTDGGTNAKNKAVDEKSGFAVKTVRIKMDGALDNLTEYRFQVEYLPKTKMDLLDAWVAYNIYESYVRAQIGQAQPKSQGDGPPEYRQFMDIGNSSDTLCSESRDRGLAINGLVLDKKLSYEVQLVNGNGISDTEHDNTDYRYSASLRYELLGKLSTFQNDIERGPLRVAVASSWARAKEKSSVVRNQYRQWYISSVNLKWQGLYVKLLGAAQLVNNEMGRGKDQRYGLLQTGYAMPAFGEHLVEPVLRYEVLDKDTHSDDQHETWVTLGLNYYLKGNNSKIQVNYMSKKEQGLDKTPNNSFKAGVAIMF